MTYLNVKVIGRRDLINLNFEAGNLSYPEDYPMTAGYTLYLKFEISRNIVRYRRLPSNKRINYDRLHSPFPFGPNFDLLSKNNPFTESYVHVQLQMVGRGIPHKHSYVCLPATEDIDTVRASIR